MKLLYPGSFDPVTNGHIDIVRRAAKMADVVVVSVLDNTNKRGLFSIDQRLEFLQHAFDGYGNVEITTYSGLVAEYAVGIGAHAILRGLRTGGDFESEMRYALNNKAISGIETIFLPASAEFAHISSSIVKEIATFDPSCHALSSMVQPIVSHKLKNSNT